MDKELIKQARILASRKATSISRLLGDELRKIVTKAADYERAKKRAMTELESGYHLGGIPAGREELHER